MLLRRLLVPIELTWPIAYLRESEAPFARDPARHFRKMAYAERILRGRDFIFVSETHNSEEGGLFARMPTGVRGYWSAGTSRRAGVGIMIRQSFLDKICGGLHPMA